MSSKISRPFPENTGSNSRESSEPKKKLNMKVIKGKGNGGRNGKSFRTLSAFRFLIGRTGGDKEPCENPQGQGSIFNKGLCGVSPGEMVRVRPTLMWWMNIFGKDFAENRKDLPPFGIDPEAFERAGISSVPALLDPTTGCVVYGDVSAEKLVEAIERKRCGEVLGRTWPIEEADGLLQIRAYLETVRLDEQDIKRRITEGLMNSLEDFRCVDLPERRDTVTYRRRPFYELDFDIRNPETGEVLYPRGFRFNPLEYVHPAGSFLIIDGRSSLQVRVLPVLLERGGFPAPVRILLTRGDAVAVGRLIGDRAPVFPSCPALKRLLSYGVCEHVPCLITFDPPYLRVKELGIGDLERYLKEEEKKGEEVEN